MTPEPTAREAAEAEINRRSQAMAAASLFRVPLLDPADCTHERTAPHYEDQTLLYFRCLDCDPTRPR